GDLGGGDLQDVRYGAHYAMDIVKTDRRPALFGGSYGGYLTLQGLLTQPNEWAGGVAISPTTDWKEDYNLSDSHYRKFCVHIFGQSFGPKSKQSSRREHSSYCRCSVFSTVSVLFSRIVQGFLEKGAWPLCADG